MTDFPSDFERDARRHERAVDEHRRREELEAEVVRLRDEVERLKADRAALEHRLEDLMVFWALGRNILVRAGDGADGLVHAAQAEMLTWCIEGLDGAIPEG
jgi:uncharacterized small protein (DUF1192 family)